MDSVLNCYVINMAISTTCILLMRCFLMQVTIDASTLYLTLFCIIKVVFRFLFTSLMNNQISVR